MATTKSQLVTSLVNYGYTLKSDSSTRGFDRQLFVKNNGVTCTVTSTSASHNIVSATTNRLDTTNQTQSVGSLDNVAAHLKQVYGQ